MVIIDRARRFAHVFVIVGSEDHSTFHH